MNKKDFQTILNSLDDILQTSLAIEQKDLTQIPTLSVNDFNDLIEKAKEAQSKQDRLMTTELYHVLGMGNLTVTQSSTFLKKVKEILSTRNSVKFVSMLQPVKIGKPDSKAEFASTLLGGKKLTIKK